jgi:hypothetical protein
MSSLRKLQDIAHTARLATQEKSPDVDALHSSIYDVVMRAFMTEVLTLSRMNGVIHAVCKGVEDAAGASSAGAKKYAALTAQREAYRGLCSAAGEGLTAVGLVYTKFFRFHESRMSVELGAALSRETRILRQQLEQVTRSADWLSNSEVTALQAHWFEQLMEPFAPSPAQLERAPALSWEGRFFQTCGYEPSGRPHDVRANLMLLGLLTSGALIVLRASHAPELAQATA